MTTTHTHKLREWAKVFTGMIIADILVGIWVGTTGEYGNVFFGIPLTHHIVALGIMFDSILLFLLIHYAWYSKTDMSPSRRTFYIFVGTLLTIVALAHVVRIFFSVPIVIGTVSLPLWISVVGAIITGFLAYTSFHFARKR